MIIAISKQMAFANDSVTLATLHFGVVFYSYGHAYY